jgi:hypothetical protein
LELLKKHPIFASPKQKTVTASVSDEREAKESEEEEILNLKRTSETTKR